MSTIVVQNSLSQPQFVLTDAGPLRSVMVRSRSTAVIAGTKLLDPITQQELTEEEAKKLGLSVISPKETAKKK